MFGNFSYKNYLLIPLFVALAFGGQAQFRSIGIDGAEFFWDSDPGQGNATPISSLDGVIDQAVEYFLDDSTNIPSLGIHVLSIRVKDENGVWSNTFSKAINVNPSIVVRSITIQEAEYFWDTDPGQGSGTALLAFDGNFNQAIEDVVDNSLNMAGSGDHVFNIG